MVRRLSQEEMRVLNTGNKTYNVWVSSLKEGRVFVGGIKANTEKQAIKRGALKTHIDDCNERESDAIQTSP